MLISILPIYLLIIHGVTSADFSSNNRVPRRHTRVIRTYGFNHPPILDNIDKIPVTVVYDDKEEVKVRNTNGKKPDDTEEEKNNLKYSTNGNGSKAFEAAPVSPPRSRVLYPFAGVDDYEEELNLKPRARSIKVPAAESDETNQKLSAESGIRSGVRNQKRVQKERKVKVDKSQLDVNVSQSKMTVSQVSQKEATATTGQTDGAESTLHTPQVFKPRMGMRDPVIPIIELESYVFSHSGDFHYSYEGGDGTKAYERGELKSFDGGAGSSVEGNFSYKDKDGNDYSLSYTADENGYRPVGAHLPTPPPIPPAIQRALDYLATKTTPEPITERTKTL